MDQSTGYLNTIKVLLYVSGLVIVVRTWSLCVWWKLGSNIFDRLGCWLVALAGVSSSNSRGFSEHGERKHGQSMNFSKL
jgi:hypothetical protein